MNKPMKRVCALLAGVATLIAALGGGSAALADDAVISGTDLATPQPLTLTAAIDLTGHSFTAVELAAYSSATTDGTNITSYDVTTTGSLASAIKESLPSGAQASDTNPMSYVAQNLLDSRDYPYAGSLRDFLTNLATKDAFKNAAGNPMTVSGKNATATVAPGLYAIVDKTAATAKNSVAIVAMTGTGIAGKTVLKNNKNKDGFTLGTVEYKANIPSVTKTITGISKHGTVSDDGKTAAAAIGSVITYTLTAKVPNTTGFTSFYWDLGDTPGTGLTFNNDDKVVAKIGSTTLAKGTDYTVQVINGSVKFLMGTDGEIINNTRFTSNAGEELTLTYTMSVNAQAKAGSKLTNSADLTYSNTPNDPTHHATTDASKTTVYVGKAVIHKTDRDGNKLADATFNVKDGDTAVKFVHQADGSYRPAVSTDTNASVDLTTDSDGNITIDGINGTYTLVETAAPSGFSQTALPRAGFVVTVVINGQAADNGTSTVSGTSTDYVTFDSTSDTVTVKNFRNLLEMPKTGAAWLVIWIAAAVLIAGAGVLLLVRGRKTATR
jgi:fimbrial isopeptide formation D2 family protein